MRSYLMFSSTYVYDSCVFPVYIQTVFLKISYGFASCRNSEYMTSQFLYSSYSYVLSSCVPNRALVVTYQLRRGVFGSDINSCAPG
jgi:hypothetical protein